MAKTSKVATVKREKTLAPADTRSAKVAAAGIKTGHDFANLMSALMSDLIEGRVPPNIGNATCNAGGKLLKVVEMQYRYGTQQERRETVLILAPKGKAA